MTAPRFDVPRFDVIVVGAGFAGLYALHRLRRLGFRAIVYEAAAGVGGTWWWNRYPGARCDVESLDYSYSFSPELEQEWEWSERYATQPEILRYLDHVADRFDLRRDIRFNTQVTACTFDDNGHDDNGHDNNGHHDTGHDDTGHDAWTIRTDGGDVVTARFLVMATGCLSLPKQPDISGVETFGGDTYHTSSWPHDGVDFTGRRVGVIGTGSSGIQAIPLIAEQADHLTVFQRTANFSSPAHNGPLDPTYLAARKANITEYRRLARQSRLGVVTELADGSAVDAEPAERERRFRAGWNRGSLFGVSTSFADLLIDARSNELACEFLRNRIRDAVDSSEVAETLAPRSHPYATKRPCLDSGYFETFNRPDVTLVDVRATPIVGIDADGVRTSAQHHRLDALVFATGFDAMTGALLAIDPIGRGGLTLAEKWANGPRTLLGLAVAGFPNLFMVTGPGSPSVLTNMVMSIEQHVEWITDCLADMRDRGRHLIEADPAAEDAWVGHVNELAELTLYPLAASWYMGANVPGKPRVFLPYVGGHQLYRQACDDVAADDYRCFTFAGS